ncbi:hypothetical protein CERSUDRAFT_101154 [Gelatoporia subvermispora B]|uniref:Uncharacterized protein n=1 Tax=Ceriporiopsis subvermispora (strain B) TaxID=914234 RepID=M2QF34_CERS8|nr:hypothetical protein CERSUDRAFT_101154 [Gelatoporia subvermispora B]
MSSSNSTIRYLSPFASSQAVLFGSNSATATSSLRTLIDAANGFEELMGVIPQEFRLSLREPLAAIGKLAEKLVAARTSLRKLEAHNTAGTLPPTLQAKAPSVAFSKEFADTDDAKAARDAISARHKSTATSDLADMIKAKKDEVRYLEEALTPTKIATTGLGVIAARYAELKPSRQVPSYNAAETEVTGWEDDPVLKSTATSLKVNFVSFGRRVVEFHEMRARVNDMVITKKREVQAAANAAMDVDVELSVEDRERRPR